jgi:hypothetical protein
MFPPNSNPLSYLLLILILRSPYRLFSDPWLRFFLTKQSHHSPFCPSYYWSLATLVLLNFFVLSPFGPPMYSLLGRFLAQCSGLPFHNPNPVFLRFRSIRFCFGFLPRSPQLSGCLHAFSTKLKNNQEEYSGLAFGPRTS